MGKKTNQDPESRSRWGYWVGLLLALYGFSKFPVFTVCVVLLFLIIYILRYAGSQKSIKKQHTKTTGSVNTDDLRVQYDPMKEEYTYPQVVRDQFPITYADSSKLKNYRSNINLRKIDPRSDSTISRLKNYIVLDLETTGLSKQDDRIVEIGLIEISGDQIVNEFHTLVNPEKHISDGASAVNGIYDSDVEGAPTYCEIFSELEGFIVGKTVLGYNVNFDLSFIQRLFDEFGVSGEIVYFDVLSYARRMIKGLPNYKLSTVAEYISVPVMPEHRAIEDAKATYYIFKHCLAEFKRQEKEAADARREERERKKLERKAIYGKSPLFDVSFVFTGEFALSRSDMERTAESAGGLVRTKVTSNTDYLVVGDISKLPDWAIERKFGKAEELRSAGKKVKNISESEFLEMISKALVCF